MNFEGSKDGRQHMDVDAAATQFKSISYPPDPPATLPPRLEMQTKVSGNASKGYKTKRGTRAGKNKKMKNALYKLFVTPKPEAAASATVGAVTHHHHHHHHHHYHQR